MEAIISSTPSLSSPRYFPTVLFSGRWSALVWYSIRNAVWRSIIRPPILHQPLALPCGGLVSLDWADDAVARALPPDAPILVLLHTLTGKASDEAALMSYAAHRGWRSVVLTRRGHGQCKLQTSRFNLLGTVEDTAAQMAAVVAAYPKAYCAMMGLSAGSGHLVNYLGSVGTATPVRAAACMSPAYSISSAFVGLRDRLPFMDRFLLKGIRECFLSEENRHLLKQSCPATLECCDSAESIHDFLAAAAKFTSPTRRTGTSSFSLAATPDGYLPPKVKQAGGVLEGEHVSTFEEFLAAHNPAENFSTVCVPTLVLNALDDPVCLKENIMYEIFEEWPGAALLVTQRGSHVSFPEGLFGRTSYMHRIALDFFDAARQRHLQLDAAAAVSPK